MASKGAVLDEQLITQVGLAENLLTLSGPMENRHHEQLQEPMFVVRTQEVQEPIYLERKYVFDNQVSIKQSYGKGEKVLCWLNRQLRTPPNDPKAAPVELLLARDFFLLGDWREFQRFKQFIKSMRIVDAQARQWLSDHQAELPELARTPEGLERILDCLGRIAEWPEPEFGPEAQRQTGSLEAVAKTYSKSLAPVRLAPLFPALLLRRPPDVRFNVFRIMSFVEDPQLGATAVVRFVVALATNSRNPELQEACAVLKTSRDLSRAFAAVRKYLLSHLRPE
jgi:hypothetical protein